MADIKKGLDLVKSLFSREVVTNETYCFSLIDVANTRLLPICDEYRMDYRNRRAILEFKESKSTDSTFVFDQTIVIDGRIIGTWKRIVTAKNSYLELTLFKKLSEPE